MAVTVKDLMRQAKWMGHKMGEATTARVAGVRRKVRKCKRCRRLLVLDSDSYYGSAYNGECTVVRKPTLYFR